MNCTSCHVPPLQGSEVPSNRRHKFTMITSFFLIICNSPRCLQTSIYIPYKNFFRHIINTITIRVFQIFHHHYHGGCRLLADGMRIFHLECHYCFTTILGRRPQSSYPRHSLRMHSFGHPPATCYDNNLKMSYLDILLLH